MTIIEAINTVDSLCHNTYSTQDKIAWLSNADSHVKRLVLDTHESPVAFSGYSAATPVDTVLLMYAPYDEAYLRYIEMQIHLHNGEYDRYNNAAAMYTKLFQAFADDYNRNHRPINFGQFKF